MAKQTATQLTDEALLQEVEAEVNAMSPEDLADAAKAAKLHLEVRKAKTKQRQMSEEQKERQRLYNKKRNIRLKLLAQKAEELNIKVSEREINAQLATS